MCQSCASHDNWLQIEESREFETSRMVNVGEGSIWSSCTFDDEEEPIKLTTLRSGGATVQVPKPPVHACIAFTSDDVEGDRRRQAQNVPALLNPKTKRLFQEIQSLGTFPRRRGPSISSARKK